MSLASKRQRMPIIATLMVAATTLSVTSSAAPGEASAMSGDSHSQASSSVSPYPGGVTPDVWVFAGQSNSQGWSLLKAPVPLTRVFYFSTPKTSGCRPRSR